MTRRTGYRSLGVGLALLAGACAAPYGQLQPGRVTPRGDFRLQVAVGAGFAPGQVVDLGENASEASDALDRYRNSDARRACDGGTDVSQCIRADELRPILDTAVLEGVAPIVSWDGLVGARYGLARRTDVGLRYGTGGLLLDGRYQFAGDPDAPTGGFEAAVGVGVGWRSGEVPYVQEGLELLGLDDHYRLDLRLPVTFSWRLGRFGYVYTGLGYILSRWHLDVDPDFAYLDRLPEGASGTARDLEDAFRSAAEEGLAGTDTDGFIHQLTGVIGVLVGYRYAFVGVELNLVRYWFEVELLHETESHSGFVFYPAATVLTEF